jgi:hypothetical protein
LNEFLSTSVFLPSRVHQARHSIWNLRTRFSVFLEAYITARFCDTLAQAHNEPDSDAEYTEGITQLVIDNHNRQ